MVFAALSRERRLIAMIRRWIFNVTDGNDNGFGVDAKGNEIDAIRLREGREEK